MQAFCSNITNIPGIKQDQLTEIKNSFSKKNFETIQQIRDEIHLIFPILSALQKDSSSTDLFLTSDKKEPVEIKLGN